MFIPLSGMKRYDCAMNKYGQKEQALIDLCGQTSLDMERFTLCLKNGVDVNASLGDEENLLLDVLWELIWHKNEARIIDVNEKDYGRTTVLRDKLREEDFKIIFGLIKNQ